MNSSTNHEVGDILNRCLQVHGERDTQYGGSYQSFERVAAVANRLLDRDDRSENRITPLDYAACMVATKEVRYMRKLQLMGNSKEASEVMIDSLVDWINYIAIMHHVAMVIQRNEDIA